MVWLTSCDLAIEELARPAAAAYAAESPLVHRGAQIVVVGQTAGDDEVVLAGAAGDRGGAGVALQRVRRVELCDVFADFARDPGGETITQARHAQVDLAARERFPRVGVLRGVIAAGAGAAAQ